MSLFDILFKNKKEDKELDDLGFFKQEKKEYKKGHYDKSNFEEEELEDDDYYSDDD